MRRFVPIGSSLEASEPGIDRTSLMRTSRTRRDGSRLVGYYDWLLQPVVSDEGAKFVIG